MRQLTSLLVLAILASTAVAQLPTHLYRYSNFSMLGVLNDTTLFHAKSSKTVVILDYTSGEIRVKLDCSTLQHDHSEIELLFRELNIGQLTFEATPDQIFDLYRQTNNGKDYPLSGWLTLNGVTEKVEGTYKLNKLPTASRDASGNTDEAPMRITLNLFLDPAKFNLGKPHTIANPLEFSIPLAFVNRVN